MKTLFLLRHLKRKNKKLRAYQICLEGAREDLAKALEKAASYEKLYQQTHQWLLEVRAYKQIDEMEALRKDIAREKMAYNTLLEKYIDIKLQFDTN